jgi:FtsH-binding integral membrane protein
MMMIMGVALWFFPRAEKQDKLYKPGLILFTYYTITISTLLRFVSQVVPVYAGLNEIWTFIATISSFGQVAGIILFFISMWGRIRSVGSHLREAKGEKF